ncbi:MAG: putative superfamily hydrolase [Deltaproteobacteria bacterium]|nr:putative superfamily hydrolase [Deltaproteobacteria bacterium]
MISKGLIETILRQYVLSPKGIHGLPHWTRVLENGVSLAQQTGARVAVVEFFAVFHDARRMNDGWDREHGFRGAELAAQFRGIHLNLSDSDFDLLYQACRDHTNGSTAADITVQTCWDADRLDLGRVKIDLDRKYLCTEAARDSAFMAWADRRSREGIVPELTWREWAVRMEKMMGRR